MEAINGSAGAARNSHQLEGGPSSDRHVKKLYVTFIDQEGGGRRRRMRMRVSEGDDVRHDCTNI